MKFRIQALSIAMSLCAMTAFADSITTPSLRTGAGYGINYGAGYGFNNELVINDYSSIQLGAGYLDHIGWGAAAGVSIYPVGGDNRYLNPRLSALYGRVGRVDLDEGAKGHRFEAVNGFALGAGGQFPIYTKRLSGQVDAYYTDPKLPNGYAISDSAHFKFSVGVSYVFGTAVQVVKVIEPVLVPAPCIPEKTVVVPVPAPCIPEKAVAVPVPTTVPIAALLEVAILPVPMETAKKICDKQTVIAISFDTGKTDINTIYFSELDKLGAFLKEFPTSKGTIEGHSDNVGSEDENQQLSQSRAESVRRYIINKYTIDDNRIVAKGYGSSKPVAPNTSESGKAQNRRIEALFSCE